MKSSSPRPPVPYPGLRAFRPEETLVFSGRGQHRAEVLDLLGASRLLAVVGPSGSGKSSLVLAGLLPDILAGQLIGVDPETVRIVSLQPGLRPFSHLAEALARELKTELALEPLLRRGPLGLVQTLDELEEEPPEGPSLLLEPDEKPLPPPPAALVLVVDQFEEIFRFADMSEAQLRREGGDSAPALVDGTQNEAQAFVNLLLQSAAQDRHLIYVLLTMRSEFLARCDQFSGLPEAISRSQFLTPRLNRQQLEQAITRPLEYFDAAIAPELVNLILNQISPAQDQLPLMQHALARMWERRAGDVLTLEDYRAVGGLTEALNNHCEEICLELVKGGMTLDQIERFFRTLAHQDTAQVPPVRRPARVIQISEETGLTTEEVRRIADAFRAERTHLLMPPTTKVAVLRDDQFIDISHESLLRQWKQLRVWIAREWRQRQMLLELEQSRENWALPEPRKMGPVTWLSRWRSAGDAVATRVYREANSVFFGPKACLQLPASARRYGIDWPRLQSFCKLAFRWKQVTSVMSAMGLGLVIMSVLLVSAMITAVVGMRKAEQARVEAHRAMNAAKAALDEESKARAVAKATADDAVSRLVDSQAQAESLKAVVNATLKHEVAPSEEVLKLLQAENIRGFVQLPQTVVSTVTPTVADDLVAPVTLPPTFLSKKANPVLAFLRDPGGLCLLVGAKGVSTTSVWTLQGQGVGEFAFEATTFNAHETGEAVVATSGGKEAFLILGRNNAVASGPGSQFIYTGKLIDLKQKLVLLGTSGGVGLWMANKNTAPRLIPADKPGIINGVDFSQGRRLILASGDEKWAKLWTIPQGAANEEGTKLEPSKNSQEFYATAPIRGATFSADGNLLLLPAGVPELQVVALDPRMNSATAVLEHQGPVGVAKFSPNSRMIASADTSGRVYLWDISLAGRGMSQENLKAPRKPLVLSGHRARLTGLQWSSDSSFFVTAGEDGICLIWQNARERLSGSFSEAPMLLPSHPGGVTGLALSPDARFVATAGVDGVARIFPLRPILTGKFREWGGPKVQGIRGGGELALMSEADVTKPEFRNLFLPKQPDGTKGLVYRLNPEAYYVNARWNYSFTPRALLRSTKVIVRRAGADRNDPAQNVEAQAVDWGPPESSGYGIDLSRGLIDRLRLQKDEEVEVEIKILPPVPAPPPSAQ